LGFGDNHAVDERRLRNHARDLRMVLDVMPSSASWQPAVKTDDILRTVRLPRRRVLSLLHELNVEGLAVEAGGFWRQAAHDREAVVRASQLGGAPSRRRS